MSSESLHKMIAITAPSGAGKTTIVNHLLDTFDFLDFSISATTRDKRPHEKDGIDYFFFSPEDFKKAIAEDKFVEWEEVYEDQFYGTLDSEIDRIWDSGKIAIFDIDVKGATNIKKKYKDQCMTLFIKPPSLEVLIERLKNRKTESEANLKKRVKRIKREILYECTFDQVLLNDSLDVAKQEAEEIVLTFIEKAQVI